MNTFKIQFAFSSHTFKIQYGNWMQTGFLPMCFSGWKPPKIIEIGWDCRIGYQYYVLNCNNFYFILFYCSFCFLFFCIRTCMLDCHFNKIIASAPSSLERNFEKENRRPEFIKFITNGNHQFWIFGKFWKGWWRQNVRLVWEQQLQRIWYLVSLVFGSYMFLYFLLLDVLFLPSKDVNVLKCRNNQFDHGW